MEILAAAWEIAVHLDAHLADFVAAHGTWVYALLFVVVFIETGLVVWPFLPGDSLLFVTGALTGDNVNYGIGRWVGPRVFHYEKSRWFNPKHLARAHQYYERHGGKTIIIARFLPIVRTYVPFVAGIGAMPYARYIGFCLLGALTWVVSLCTAGYFFGNLPLVKNNLSVVIVLIVLVSISPGVYAWLKARSVRSHR